MLGDWTALAPEIAGGTNERKSRVHRLVAWLTPRSSHQHHYGTNRLLLPR